MRTIKQLVLGTSSLGLLLVLNGFGRMTTQHKSAALGAGVGGVAGAMFSAGSALGILSGAALGGVVGNQIGK